MSLMRHSSRSKKLAVLIISLLVIATVTGYHHFIYLPEKQEEERIKPLMEYSGLTREEAIRFDRKFKGYAPYNQTLLDFAYFLKRYPLTASEIFRLTNSFPITVVSLKNAEPIISEIVTGDQKGRDFVLRYSFLILDDGLNETDVKLMFYDFNMKDLTSYVIEKIKDQPSRITTLGLLYPNVLNGTLTEGQALDFIKKYPWLLPLNYSSLVLAKHWSKVQDLVDFLIGRYPINIAKDSIILLYPNILNGTLTKDISINFIIAYPDLVKDGINQENLAYLKLYSHYPTLVDTAIKSVPYELGVPLILNLNPFLLNNTFTENKAAYFINLYPHLARSFGLHKDFPRLVYLFTQIPKSVDTGIKTIEDFDFLVDTLNSVLRYVDETKKDEERISFFMERYPWLIKEFNWDEGTRKIFEFHELHPTLADTLLRLDIKRDHVLSTIHNVKPYLKQIPESVIDDFIKSYRHFVQDGLDEIEARLLPYYHKYRLLTDTAIKELKDLDSILFVLDSYHPYIEAKEISSLRLKRYILDNADLFRVKEYVHPLADPDEDYMNNITEIKILRDLFLGIGNLTWNPTKVVNNKVYEGNVYIRAKSVRGILPSKLYWIPINYTQFPKEVQLRAFPNETIREFALIPVNDNLIESLVFIEGFKGGREYRIVVPIRDIRRSITEEIKTPYMREFENIAPLDDKLVGVLYLLWWGKHNNWAEYKGPDLPLLGRYSSKDKIVINRHIDWATGHGIDCFIINWSGEQDFQDEALREYFLEVDLVKQNNIKFAILYETTWRLKDSHPGWNLSDPQNIETLKQDFSYFARKYFTHPSYLRIGERNFIFIYESKSFFGNIMQLNNIREYIKSVHGQDLYLVSDHAHPEAHPSDKFRDVIWGEVAKYFDAIMNRWGWEKYPESDFERWLAFAKNNNLGFIPGASVGLSYKYAPWGEPKEDIIPRDPILFAKRVSTALKYMDPSLRMLFIPEFNNFFENSYLEPSQSDGFKYLETLRNVLKSSN